MKKNIAAVDVGTNSFHMLVVRPEEPRLKFRVLEHVRETVRLGSGSADMKNLRAVAMKRAEATLLRFKKIADAYNAEVRAIGTSAVREALNGALFIARVGKKTGIAVETVSAFEEARLVYLGVLQSIPIYNKKALLLHIGGGSTELVVGLRKEVLYGNGVKLGAIRLTERFFPNGSYTDPAIRACRRYVAGMLGPVERAIRAHRAETIVGSSGTILAVGRLALSVKPKPFLFASLNGLTLSKAEVLDAIDTMLRNRSARQLTKLPGIDRQRADIITAGAVILEQLMLAFDIPELVFSEGSIREGIVLDTLEKRYRMRSHRHLRDLRRRSVENLARTFAAEKKHFSHTAFLSLRLFDDLHSLHGLGEDKRELLEYAAILHDIGFFISHAQHHRHSYYLIRNAELLGFTENEKAVIANIARYHRKSHPKPKHEGFLELSPADQHTVLLLASLLRVADGLDRSHRAMVRDARCFARIGEVVCNLTPRSGANLDLELWGAEWKKALFEEVYGKKLTLRVKKPQPIAKNPKR